MSRKLAIVGAGGLGREVLSLVCALPNWQCVGFYDDGQPTGRLVHDLPVLGGLSHIRPEAGLWFVVAIGDPHVKAQVVARLPAVSFATLIHPRALLQDEARISVAEGAIIGAGAVLTTGIQIGAHVLLNLNCTIGHDVRIGNCCSVMPGANLAGSVSLGERVLVGSGANLLHGIAVGDGARVGSGAVVTRNVAAGITVTGVPARPRGQ
jgi:sugar O-acyltransferase (sialic acid O-acetyltransferase NeuD family)